MKRRESVFAPTQELSLDEFVPARGNGDPMKIEIADWSHLPEEELLRAEFTASLRKTIELCRRYGTQELPEPIAQSAREKLLEAYQKMLAARGR